MATYYTLLTKIGQARIANAVALNQKVNLTYMAVGDGNGNPTTPNENQTALVREKYRATINQLTVDQDNPNYLVAELIVPTNVGGWSIYEVGVFDDQNQLIAVANFPATYKPELAEGSGRDLIVRIIIQVSNTSVVTLKIDPAITLASQAWVAANFVKKTTVAGGTTGQVLVKKSNANEDFQWVDPTAAVDVNVFSREETQTVATGQTIINLAQLTTDGAAIYIEGIRLRDDQFTVNSATRLTLATSYPAGTKVTIVQNEETSRNAFMLKANNLSDLTDKGVARVNINLERFQQTTSETLVSSPDYTRRLSVGNAGTRWGMANVADGGWVPLDIEQGGTGAKTAAEALTKLGLDPTVTKAAGSMQKNANGSDIQDTGAFQNNLGLTFNGTINSLVARGPGLMIQQGGKITAPEGTGSFLVINFPVSFPNGCVAAFAIFEDGVYNQAPFEIGIVPENSRMTVGIISQGGSVYFNNRAIRWYAVGF